MSYGIIRYQKFKASGVRGIQSHDLRERPSHTNPDIDQAKTAENYSLVESANFNADIQKRLETLESIKAVRKDAVVMCQMLVTSDKDFFDNLTPAKEKEFFEQSLKFITDRYGKENIISATVHRDEKTPHMHVNFTPVRGSRLTANTIFDRKELQALQTDFHASMGQMWGLKRGESRDEKRRHLDTEAYKLKIRQEEIQIQHTKLAGRYWLEPNDVESQVLEKGFFSKTKETSIGIANRINKSHIQPLNFALKDAQEKLKGFETIQKEYEKTTAELVEYRKNFTDGLQQEQIESIKKYIQEKRELNRINKIFFEAIKKIPADNNERIDIHKKLMTMWNDASNKVKFEKEALEQCKQEQQKRTKQNISR
jgi:hypothetical protein